MSTTRRKFLKAGMFAAMFAAVPLSKVAGKELERSRRKL
jgi:hypothetical protein